MKHATPCGIASADSVAVAYERAYASDEISPFGGIIAVNREVTWDMTEAMKGKRYDIIVAPGYEERALERLKKRRDLRILRMPESAAAPASTGVPLDPRRRAGADARHSARRGPRDEGGDEARADGGTKSGSCGSPGPA